MTKKVILSNNNKYILKIVCKNIIYLILIVRQIVLEKKVNKFILMIMNNLQKKVESNQLLQIRELVNNIIEKYIQIQKKLIYYILYIFDDLKLLFYLTN